MSRALSRTVNGQANSVKALSQHFRKFLLNHISGEQVVTGTVVHLWSVTNKIKTRRYSATLSLQFRLVHSFPLGWSKVWHLHLGLVSFILRLHYSQHNCMLHTADKLSMTLLVYSAGFSCMILISDITNGIQQDCSSNSGNFTRQTFQGPSLNCNKHGKMNRLMRIWWHSWWKW